MILLRAKGKTVLESRRQRKQIGGDADSLSEREWFGLSFYQAGSG